MSCSLCDLPTPEPSVTDEAVEGTYCCRGCLEVARALGPAGDRGDVADADGGVDSDAVRDAIAGDEVAQRADRGDPVGADLDETFLRVEGMHCSTCEAFLEGTLAKKDGVARAEANYPADLVRVAYDADRVDAASLPAVVDGLGYAAALASDDRPDQPGEDRTTARLLVGGFFGMMAMLWYVLFLYPAYLDLPQRFLLVDLGGGAGAYLLWNVWLAATVVLGYTGFPILRGAYVSLRAGLPNMDLLVALAAVTAWTYSTLVLLLGGVEVYFDVAVAVVLVVTFGERYEKRVKRAAAGRLSDLTASRVDRARRLVADDGPPAHAADREVEEATDREVEAVAVDDLAAGDRVVVRTGDRVPVDGTVVEGEAACDESLLTGESRPVVREAGDDVIGGALVVDGRLVVAVAPGGESTLDRLVTFLWEVQSSRHGAQRLADRLATLFVPLVVAVAVVAGGAHLLLGASPTAALLTALTVLVVSCPCALGLATPLASAAGVRAALDRGIVVTDASLFERATEADVVVLDKTGTLTTGAMRVLETVGDDGALNRAAAVEQFADHPVADAVVDAATVPDLPVEDFERVPGRGAAAVVDGERVVVGRRDLLESEGFDLPPDLVRAYDAAERAGRVPTLVGWDQRVRGVVVAGDTPREGWEHVVDELAARVDRVVVLTGDAPAAAAPFESQAGIDEVFAEVPPEGKAAVVERLGAGGTVAMVGDGSNDAPALAAADVGIAVAEGTDLAAEAAAAVVTGGDLGGVPRAFDVARATRRRIRENLGWAFGYNVVAIPLAATGLLNPLFAALAMSASSLLVVANSARGFGGEGVQSGESVETGDGSMGIRRQGDVDRSGDEEAGDAAVPT